ncbi:MAG: glycosyltransferase family 2 protein [Nanoarchaeota archaeon]
MQRTKRLPSDLWVVLPGHNEEGNLAPVLKRIKRYTKNIVFVDDGSTDDTYQVALDSGVTVLRHITNLGKGAALKTGCDHAVKTGAERIVVMDSDGQHDPDELHLFVEKLEAGRDVVVGCRKWNNDMPFVMKLGNFGLHKISSLFFAVDIPDTQSGYRAFTAQAYDKIRWDATDYAMESEMIARIHKHHLDYATIRIKTIYHDDYKGTTVLNGIKIATNMLLWKVFGLS